MRDSLVVAPFWSDTDIRLAGNIHYRLIEAGRSTGEFDKALLDFVGGLVAARGPESAANFSATAMLMAQWLNVPPYPHGANSSDISPTLAQFITQVAIMHIVSSMHLQLVSRLSLYYSWLKPLESYS